MLKYKEVLKTLLVKIGFKRYARKGLNNIDKKLEKYLNSIEKGFFIEAGANDGVKQSNTYFLENIKNWSGVLIEGVPDLYKKCKENRKKSHVYNCILVADEEIKKMDINYADLMSVVSESQLNNSDYIQLGLKVQNIDSGYKVSVPARTLNSILSENNICNVDFFSLDVEGYELEVLKGIDFNKIYIRYILVEILDYKDKAKIDDFLKKYYIEIDRLSEHDYLYARK